MHCPPACRVSPEAPRCSPGSAPPLPPPPAQGGRRVASTVLLLAAVMRSRLLSHYAHRDAASPAAAPPGRRGYPPACPGQPGHCIVRWTDSTASNGRLPASRPHHIQTDCPADHRHRLGASARPSNIGVLAPQAQWGPRILQPTIKPPRDRPGRQALPAADAAITRPSARRPRSTGAAAAGGDA